jgi:hypothetical protein
VDPITLTVLAAIGLAGSGGVAAMIRARRAHVRQAAMREAVRKPIPLGAEPPVSLFDVFWDLGASDFALELMASQQLLLEEPEGLGEAARALREAVALGGSYKAFIEEQLETIQEYYREHRGAGDRRAIPALSIPAAKALPPMGGTDAGVGALRVPSGADGSMAADRNAWRTGAATGPLHGSSGTVDVATIDVDQVLDVDLGRLLGSIFDGSIGRQAKRWFAMRSARTLRGELDRALEELYRTFATHLRPYPAQMTHLHDAARRWEADATRIEMLLEAAPHSGRPWARCGETLLEAARNMAQVLAKQAADNVADVLDHIDALAAEENTAMAGYFVYVNRYPLFVGRMELAMPHIGNIETALARLQRELGELGRKGF